MSYTGSKNVIFGSSVAHCVYSLLLISRACLIDVASHQKTTKKEEKSHLSMRNSRVSNYTTITNVFTNLLSVPDICSFKSTIDFFDWECNLWCHLLRIVSCHVLPCLNFWWFYGVGGIASIQGPTLVSNIFCSGSDGSVKAVTAKWSINIYYVFWSFYISKYKRENLFLYYLWIYEYSLPCTYI